MMVLKCKVCGGDVELSSDKTYGICSHCGNNVKLSKTREDQRIPLKNIADNVATASLERLIQNSNTYLELSDYSSAQEVFNRITKEYPEYFRGWWGLIVCETRGFEIIKKDQTKINKWFKNVKQLAHEEAFSIYRPEFEAYVRKIANVDSEHEIVKFNGIIDDLNEIIKELDFDIEQIKQYKERQNDDYHSEILIKNRDINFINYPDSNIVKPKNKIFKFIKIYFGGSITLAACLIFIFELESNVPVFMLPVMAFICSKLFLSYYASFLIIGIMLFCYKNLSVATLGMLITFFSGIAILISYIKSKKKKAEEAYKIKVKMENIEREKEEITNQYKDNVNALDKQIDKINNQISEIKNIIENCKKYLAYDIDKIIGMFFSRRCADFGITQQFDNEIEKLREEVIEASNKYNKQAMSSILNFTDNELSNKKSDKEKKKNYINTAETVELFTGEFIVGKDVKAGRYDIRCEDSSGNFFVYEGDSPVVNEILTSSIEEKFSLDVTKIQYDLKDGQKIIISDLDSVFLSPTVVELSTKLSTGIHIVGRDVPAGDYIATAPNCSGNFFVYNSSGQLKVNEILGKDDMGQGVEKIKLTLKDCEKIIISGIELVELNNLN